MSESSAAAALPGARPNLDSAPSRTTALIFVILLALGIGFVARGLIGDLDATHTPPLAIGAFVLLGIALLIALGFEFVNGFHDTANAVATVIYTHSLPANVAVIWSGLFNFLGVLTSSGAVAFSVLSLLPVELILQVGSSAGFAMIFALLIAAIVWNLGTWSFGLPASSSHTLIGSIIGVGLANQFLAPAGTATSGVDWGQAMGVFRALLFSPVVGFVFSALLLLLLKAVVRNKTLYQAPTGNQPPPLWIRGLLVLTCTSVSFAHGSNDGQKGMGLIMLILIGSVPTAYALNRAMPVSATPAFLAATQQASAAFAAHDKGATLPVVADARAQITAAIRSRQVDSPAVFAALASLSHAIGEQVRTYGSIGHVPAEASQNVRNDMFLVDEAVRVMQKQHVALTPDQAASVKSFRAGLEASTRFIPIWVKVAVAIALGLGTMIGWKRIVVTVGERIGKTHLSYGQGAAAEIIAAATIGAADMYGLPVSTTHVLSSGVAGTMAANGAGLQWSTVKSIALAWVLTLPAAMLLSGCLYALLRMVT